MSAAAVIPVEIGGQTYRLVFKFGSLRRAEQELGRPINEVVAGGMVGLEVLSAVFWAALQPDHMMTRDASDNLIDEAGMAQVAEWVGQGIARYFGAGEADAEAAAPGEAKAGKKGK